MRARDIADYLRLRKLALNPWRVLRFRREPRNGARLLVMLRGTAPLELRAGFSDFHMFDRIFLRDEYRLRDLPRVPWECVVDLGANVGIFAARVAAQARRVIAYEPMPENFAQLLRNVAGRGNVTAVEGAIAAAPGTLRLFRPRHDAMAGAYSAHADLGGFMTGDYREVEGITLDRLFASHDIARCDLLKLDVEGHEYEILYAASAATLARVERIHGEYHDVRPEDPRTRIDHFARFLEERGFLVRLHPHRRKANHGLFFAARA